MSRFLLIPWSGGDAKVEVMSKQIFQAHHPRIKKPKAGQILGKKQTIFLSFLSDLSILSTFAIAIQLSLY